MNKSSALARRELPAPVASVEIYEGEIVSDRANATVRAAPLHWSQITGDGYLALLLADKRSPSTKSAYYGDLVHFFGGHPTDEEIFDFWSWPPREITKRMVRYKGDLINSKYAENTINRRLSAVRALLKLGWKLEICKTDGRGLVDGEKATAYRDTRGVDVETIKELLAAPMRLYPGVKKRGKLQPSLRGLRDTAILRLLCEWALRRAEVCKLDVGDLDERQRRIAILGKGRGSQKEWITISRDMVRDLEHYLDVAGHEDGALFRNLDHRPSVAGTRLTHDGLYWLIKQYGAELDIPNLTPHKLRHSAITAALDATNGDVRRVKKFSRHKKYETLEIYDDNRADFGGEISNLLSGLYR
jgi:integrase/recombinase XerC